MLRNLAGPISVLRTPTPCAGLRITNFEMETAGIYGLGRLLGHSCLSLSAIVANRIEKQFSKDGDAAVARLIRETLRIVEGL